MRKKSNDILKIQNTFSRPKGHPNEI